MKIFSLLYILAYIFIRYYIFETNPFPESVIYGFEAFFVIVGMFVFKFKLPKLTKINPIGLLSAFVIGGLIFWFTKYKQWNIPLDFKSTQTAFLLLIVAPFLEEFIFRYAIWEAFERISNYVVSFALTSIAFSASHFYAYFFVPEEYKGFVIFQTIYTFGLALACGYQRMKKNSLIPAIAIHFVFNSGFLVAGLLL